MIRGVKIKCFFFLTLKDLKNIYELGKIFDFGFCAFSCVFFKGIDWFNKVPKVFLGFWVKNWLKISFLGKKKSCFSGHTCG